MSRRQPDLTIDGLRLPLPVAGEIRQSYESFGGFTVLRLGLKEENLRLRDHTPEELSFYSVGTTDFEFMFPFGWGELWGVADRTDYDLTQHTKFSGKVMMTSSRWGVRDQASVFRAIREKKPSI